MDRGGWHDRSPEKPLRSRVRPRSCAPLWQSCWLAGELLQLFERGGDHDIAACMRSSSSRLGAPPTQSSWKKTHLWQSLLFAWTCSILALSLSGEPSTAHAQSAQPTGARAQAEPVQITVDEGTKTVAVVTQTPARNNRWITDRAPTVLLRRGPAGLPWWQWLGIPLLVLSSWLLGFAASRLSIGVLQRFAQRTRNGWDEVLLTRIRGPLTLAWSLGACYVLEPWLGLPPGPERFAVKLLKLGLFVAFFWFLSRVVETVATLMARSPWAERHPASRSLLPLAGRIMKFAILAMGVVAIFAELGYPVASLIAGLGVGGIAVALAAQKTVENLFGAFSLGVDEPFRAGDFVKVDEVTGTVESIGLRSTRIRTLDRTLVTIPNGKVAEMRIESYSVRDRTRFACKLGLVYTTSSQQMRQVLTGLEDVLRRQPKLWRESYDVALAAIGPSSLDIEVSAWFETTANVEFLVIRGEVLMGFMQVVEEAGTSLAFPTRTIHVLSQDDAPAAPLA